MTESEKAIDAALSFECKKDGMRQSQSGDWKLTLTVQAQDMPTEVLTALMGDRFMAVLVAIDTDEMPIKIEAEKPKNGNVAQAVMLCKDEEYQRYAFYLDSTVLNERFLDVAQRFGWEEVAVGVMRAVLHIKSRSEVSSGEAAKRFKRHVFDFNQWKG